MGKKIIAEEIYRSKCSKWPGITASGETGPNRRSCSTLRGERNKETIKKNINRILIEQLDVIALLQNFIIYFSRVELIFKKGPDSSIIETLRGLKL